MLPAGAKKQKGDRRADTRAFAIDARKQRHNGARADSNQRSGQCRRRVGHVGRRMPAQPAGDTGLRNEGRHGAGNEERRQQAEQHVGRQVGGQTTCPAIEQLEYEFHGESSILSVRRRVFMIVAVR
jgi:hypothetical protein